jgi:hypothetical protein
MLFFHLPSFQNFLFSTFGCVLFAIPMQANAKSCNFDWRGSWQMTAEGIPVSIYTIEKGNRSPELKGKFERYDKSIIGLDDSSIEGTVNQVPLSEAKCSDRSISLTGNLPDGSTSELKATAITADEAWIEIADLPDGYQSPKFLFRKVPDSTSLPTLKSPLTGLSNDLWGVQNTSPNQEMSKIFSDDQAIREEMVNLGGYNKVKDDATFMKRWQDGDIVRLAKTRELLTEGQLKSGVDYYRAAFVFQHSLKAEDYLKAHNLAIISMALGYKNAAWISAATLDRYLQNIGQPQIYGTQFTRNQQGGLTQERFNKILISDSERKALGVPALSEQTTP